MGKRMDAQFAVFNLHVNDAGTKADAEFIAQFGQEAFDKEIAPLHEAGIMSVFKSKPTLHRFAWVALCVCFVNAGAKACNRQEWIPAPRAAAGACTAAVN